MSLKDMSMNIETVLFAVLKSVGNHGYDSNSTNYSHYMSYLIVLSVLLL